MEHAETAPREAAGQIEIVRGIASPPEGIERTLRVFLPADYHAEPTRRFPVLYLHDGQNVFDHPRSECPPTWGVNTTMTRLAAQRRIAPWIVVAIDHRYGDRLDDYSPWPDASSPSPRGDAYAAFLAEHLVPRVDATWRTIPERDARAVAGSSMGGMISLYAGFRHAGVFGRVGALSPTVMWADRMLFRRWSRRGELASRIYVDAGARELFDAGGMRLDYGTAARDFGAHLLALGYEDEREVRLVLDPEGDHSEASWRRRLPAALPWLLSDYARS